MIDFNVTVYRYCGFIHPHSLKAKTKGEIGPSSVGKNSFDFIAPNDETAMSYLNWFYLPDDIRPIHGIKMLSDFRKQEIATPGIWKKSIIECIALEYWKQNT